MKQLSILPVILLSCALSIVARAQEIKAPLLQEIFYTVKVQEKSLYEAERQWWHQNLEASVHHNFVGRLFKEIKAGKLKVFRPEYPYKTPMSAAEVKNLVTSIDSVYTEDAEGVFRIIAKVNELQSSDITALGFYEHWRYDSLSKLLDKEVKGLVLYRSHYSESGDQRGIMPLFYLALNAPDIAAISQPSLMAVPLITYDTRIKNFDWETRESTWWYENLEPSKRYAFASSILNPALKGDLPVRSAAFPFETSLTKAEVNYICTQYDSVYMEDIYTGELLLAPQVYYTTPFDINWIRFHEAWYFDPAKLAMHKEIKGFALLKDRVGEIGEVERDQGKPLFYVAGKDQNKLLPAPSSVQVPRIDMLVCVDADGNCAKGVDVDKWKKQMAILLEDVRSQKRPASKTHRESTDPDPLAQIPLTPNDLKTIFTRVDSTLVEDPETGLTKTIKKEMNLDAGSLTGMGFSESWAFDPAAYSLHKKVICIEPALMRTNPDGEVLGYQRLFRLTASPADPQATAQPQYQVGSNVESDIKVNAFYGSEEIYQDMWWDNNLEISRRKEMVEKWLNDVGNNKIIAYEGADITKKLNPEVVRKGRIIEDPDLLDMYPIGHIPWTFSDFPILRFREDWYFDPVKCSFYKKVKGVTLMLGEPDGSLKPLFYIPLNP